MGILETLGLRQRVPTAAPYTTPLPVAIRMEEEAKQKEQEETERIMSEYMKALPKEQREIAEAEQKREDIEAKLAVEKEKRTKVAETVRARSRLADVKRETEKLSRQRGLSQEALSAGFQGEYKKVQKLIREGRAREQDVQYFRELINEANVYSIDEDILDEITKLRRRIEGQAIVKGISEVAKAVPKFGVAAAQATTALARGGKITLERPTGVSGEGTAVSVAAPVRRGAYQTVATISPQQTMGMPAEAASMYATPGGRGAVSSGQAAFETPIRRVSAPDILGIPMTGRKSLPTGVKIPNIRDFV